MVTSSTSSMRGAADLSRKIARRVKFYERTGIFRMQAAGFEVERATSVEELWEAYCLVHDCFVERSYMDPTASGARIRPFEALPEMATFVAKSDGKVVAVTSVLEDSALGLPSDKAFGTEIDQLRGRGRRVCEITNLAVHPDFRRSSVFSELTRCCLAHALARGCELMFVSVSPEHAAFFREVLLFDECGSERSYSCEIEDIVVGLVLDAGRVKDRSIEIDEGLGREVYGYLRNFYFASNPYHNWVEWWIDDNRDLFADCAPLKRLFVERDDLLRRCNPKELAAIRDAWGEEVFNQVVTCRERNCIGAGCGGLLVGGRQAEAA